MALADYKHWNEDAYRIWWEEEGKHAESDGEAARDEMLREADEFADMLTDEDDDGLLELASDESYFARWPAARKVVEWELHSRGLVKA